MARRSRHSQTFSLFSFQDIISAVTAVIILIALILSIELVSQASSPAKVAGDTIQETVDELAKQLESLKKKKNNLQSELTKINAKNKRISKIPINELREQVPRLRRELAALQQQEKQIQTELQNVRRQELRASDEDASSANRMAEIESLEEEISDYEQELDEIKNKNVLTFNRSGLTGKRAWLVDISAHRIQVAEVGGTEQYSFEGSYLPRLSNEFLAWVKPLDTTKNYFLLLFRPSGAEVHGPFPALVQKIQGRGFPVGIDLIEEDQTIRFND